MEKNPKFFVANILDESMEMNGIKVKLFKENFTIK